MKTILHIVLRAVCPFIWIVFMLCTSLQSSAQSFDVGKSYINITKGVNGGTIETGDVLEIRASFVVRSGTYDSCRFQDVVPAGTSYIPGTIAVLTNEGKVYKSFTDAYGDDCGWITGFTVTINLGFRTSSNPATAFRRGRVGAGVGYKPIFSNSCIMICSYRVTVTAATYGIISTGGGTFTSKNGTLNPVVTTTLPANTIMVYPNYGICANTVGTNAIGTESNGTFGSGKARNRAASLNVPASYTYTYFDVSAPQDYLYGIPNNTSTRSNYTTVNTWNIPDATSPTHRVHQVWDIIGDHTGASNPFLGNPPADTVASSTGGYMLVINAAYRIDSAFQQTITGLCPNTYYELSCWMRNICSRCGADSNGTGPSGGGYIPTGPNDSSGVRPNITFEIDGVDYYTTGNLAYTGLWVKKGFTFLTGPSQTSFTLKYFNNAPGGGGNDWALDDISVATCSPNMKYAPTNNPIVCDSNSLVIGDTVRSYFNNYTYYKWQRSTNGGASWTDVTAVLGPATPTWNGTAWEWVGTYTIPNTQTYIGNNGDLYRLMVATTIANLSDANCRFTDAGNINLHVITCGPILATDLLSFNGRIQNGQAVLNWTTSKETEALTYYIEKSTDGVNFRIAGTVSSYNDPLALVNSYSFTDPETVTGQVFYRVRLFDQRHHSKFSRTIQLSTNDSQLSFARVINPFTDQLQFDLVSTENSKVTTTLIDTYGMTIKRQTSDLAAGVNNIILENTRSLPSGIYTLKVQSGNTIIQKRVVKQNR